MLNDVSAQIVLFTITLFAPEIPTRLRLHKGHYLRVSVQWGFSRGNLTHKFPAGLIALRGATQRELYKAQPNVRAGMQKEQSKDLETSKWLGLVMFLFPDVNFWWNSVVQGCAGC